MRFQHASSLTISRSGKLKLCMIDVQMCATGMLMCRVCVCHAGRAERAGMCVQAHASF